MATQTIKLKKPIPREDGSTITELRIRDEKDLTLGDLLAIERLMTAENTHERACANIMRDNGLLREEAELIGYEDYVLILKLMSPKAPETAAKSSS